MQYNKEQKDATLPSASIEQNRLLCAVFISRSTRCAFVLKKEISDEEKVKELEDRAMDLSDRCTKENDVLSKNTTFNDEIEILLIRVILRFKQRHGCFPNGTQFTDKTFDELYNIGQKSLNRFDDFMTKAGLK